MSIAAQNSSPDVANPGVRPIMPVPGEAQILVTHTDALVASPGSAQFVELHEGGDSCAGSGGEFDG